MFLCTIERQIFIDSSHFSFLFFFLVDFCCGGGVFWGFFFLCVCVFLGGGGCHLYYSIFLDFISLENAQVKFFCFVFNQYTG